MPSRRYARRSAPAPVPGPNAASRPTAVPDGQQQWRASDRFRITGWIEGEGQPIGRPSLGGHRAFSQPVMTFHRPFSAFMIAPARLPACSFLEKLIGAMRPVSNGHALQCGDNVIGRRSSFRSLQSFDEDLAGIVTMHAVGGRLLAGHVLFLRGQKRFHRRLIGIQRIHDGDRISALDQLPASLKVCGSPSAL